MKLNMSLDNSMAISIKSRIKLEGSDVTSSQINALTPITVVSTGEVGQTLVVQPVQQTSVAHTYIDLVIY